MEKFEPIKKVEASKPQAGEKQGSKIKGFDVVFPPDPGIAGMAGDVGGSRVTKDSEIKSRSQDLTESGLAKQQADFMTKFESAVKSAATDGGKGLEALYGVNEAEIKAVQQHIAQLGKSLETALTKI